MTGFRTTHGSLLAATIWIGGVAIKPVEGGVVTFLNDYEGFLAAAGDVRVIDFETLPDGSPSHVGVPIRPDFNYTSQGVTFSAPVGDLFIGGNSVSGFTLIADAYLQQEPTWILADLSPPAFAVGVTFAGFMELRAYGLDEALIASATYGTAGGPFFVGIVSEEPILQAHADKHDDVNFASVVLDFAYAPVPEPATLVLLLTGAVALVRWRPRNQA